RRDITNLPWVGQTQQRSTLVTFRDTYVAYVAFFLLRANKSVTFPSCCLVAPERLDALGAAHVHHLNIEGSASPRRHPPVLGGCPLRGRYRFSLWTDGHARRNFSAVTCLARRREKVAGAHQARAGGLGCAAAARRCA